MSGEMPKYGDSFEEAYDNLGKSYEVYPAPCECGKGEWEQTGYDPNFEGYELIDYKCTYCGRLASVQGQGRWNCGRI